MDAASAANLASLSLRSRFQLPAQLLGAPASARVLLADSYLLPGNTVPMAMENHLLMAAQQQQVIVLCCVVFCRDGRGSLNLLSLCVCGFGASWNSALA